MLRLEIKVKKSDINHGKRGVCYSCPIALDIKRALINEELKDVVAQVNKREVSFQKDILVDINEVSVNLPKEATDFILLFDYDEHVKPFKFVLVLTDDKEKQLKELNSMKLG